MVEIKIAKNTIHTKPGGTFDMKDGNEIEKRIAKLYILQARIDRLIHNLADSGETDTKLGYSSELIKLAEAIYANEYKDYVENYALWKMEFDPAKYTIPAFIAESPDWEDISWHNDACPRFLNTKLKLELFIEADEEANRECESDYRFALHSVVVTPDNTVGNWLGNVAECDTEEELAAILNKIS